MNGNDKGNVGKLRLKLFKKTKAENPGWRVMYLQPVPWEFVREDLLEEILSGRSKSFDDFVLSHVQAYIEDGEMPPESIAAAIINIAEDIQSGNEPAIKAGDYISLQNAMRK